MRWWQWNSGLPVLLVFVLITGCNAVNSKPDWKALYEKKLGQPISKIHEVPLNQEVKDGQRYLSRISVAKLDDGTTVFLGFPAGQEPQSTVDQTIVLNQAQWREACRAAVGKKITRWGHWEPGSEPGSDAVVNQLNVHASTTPTVVPGSVIFPDPKDPICQFRFLSGSWVLWLAYDKGAIKP